MSERLADLKEDMARLDELQWRDWLREREKRQNNGPYVMGGIDQHIMHNPGPPPIHDALPDDVSE